MATASLEAYLESPCSFERKRGDSLRASTSYVYGQHVSSAFIEHFDNRDGMLLQSWVGKLIDGIVSFVASVLDRLRDILDELIYLLFFCRRRVGIGTYEGDQGLDALDKQSRLVFEVVLRTSIDRGCQCRL